MKHKIQKERIHLFSPCVNVCAVSSFNQKIEADVLHNAIKTAAVKHRILCSHVEIEPDGSAYIAEDNSTPAIHLQEYNCSIEQLTAEQENIPFHIHTGDYIRFFYKHTGQSTEFVVIAHHLVSDGGSLMILMEDILLSLNDQIVTEKPVHLLSRNDLPAHPKLNLFLRMMMRRTNSRWEKTGKIFTFQEQQHMLEQYDSIHQSALFICEIEKTQLDGLKQLAHKKNITINSLLTTAFASVLPSGNDIGIAVDIRPKNISGMGNFATGISLKESYDPRQDFIANAVDIHSKIRGKLNNPKEKYFLHEFMSALSPALTDSIYFTLYGGYQNPISDAVCKMCGYSDKPMGISTSNLCTISMPEDSSWKYSYNELYFIPPYIPNVKAVIGISTFNDKMTITLHTVKDETTSKKRQIFEEACTNLLHQLNSTFC